MHILKKPKGHIRVAKIKEQNPPKQLELIKEEVFKRWPSTSLLDILKEVDLFVNFTDDFVASGPKTGLDKEIICKRLLLAILGYGTNTGLKSMSNGEISYQDLQYIKLRYFDQENLQAAIRKIVNSLLKIRFTSLWGDNTTSVASDSKHFKASDQNLMSSWHPRYHSKGVYHTGHRRIIRDIEGFKKFIELNFDKTTMELANNWSQKVSASTISRLLNKLGYSYKKNFSSSQKGYWSKE